GRSGTPACFAGHRRAADGYGDGRMTNVRRIARGNMVAPLVPTPDALLAALPHPVIAVAEGERIVFANPPAEQFFDMSAAWLKRQPLSSLLPFGSQLLALIGQVEEHGVTVSE